MGMRVSKIWLGLALASCAGIAQAYIGPGAGLSLIGSLFGWIVGIFLTLFAIVLWPLRYLLRRAFRRRGLAATAADSAPSDPAQVQAEPRNPD